MTKLKTGSVLILDFGSQYTQLIARRVRENNVFSEILSPDTSLKTIVSKKPKAIILQEDQLVCLRMKLLFSMKIY